MPKTHKCSFCGQEFQHGTGLMYVKTDSTVYWFCSSKCRKNMLVLKREPKKYKWTTHYARKAKKE
ncbi:50S ribosomal protein L24e [Candidatus Bathyarchaeota archaeon]|nr:50S ribosomal protein L24e [Candidatus Bathyarchaeota archaeon]